MKKLALLTTMIICCTFASWAQGLSFTIYSVIFIFCFAISMVRINGLKRTITMIRLETP